MIGTHPAARAADAAVLVQDAARPAGDTALAAKDAAIEAGLATAVIDTLLREDYAGLAGRVRATADGPVLDWPGGPVLPLRPDGFLADLAVAGPAPLTLGDVSSLLAAVAPAADADGVAAFGVECRQALATLRLRERHLREGTTGGEQPRDLAAGSWLGAGGAVGYDALAAARPHPAYPTAACRLGFTDEDSRRYAPEFRPEFELAWAAIPRTALVTSRPGRPDWWPEMTEVGLPAGLADSHELLPVHPLTARLGLDQALAEAGLAGGGLGGDGLGGDGLGGAVAAPGRWLAVRPTLSTRTVAVTADPGVQLKLPLAVSTLGRLNRRGLVPRTLSDGALIGRLLAGLAARDPALGGLLLADDGDFAHAGHPALGYLRRRLPDGLGACRVVSVAALLAPVPGTEGPMEAPGAAGRLVIDELAGLGWGGDPVAFFRAYLDLLFGVQVRLFTRYGIALESHQQNAAVVAGAGALRLLVKDFDGALIRHARLAGALAGALGGAGPEPGAFGDQRLLAGSDDELADVFITITVHLCAGALAFGLARRGYAPLGELLAAIRAALAGALDREDDTPAARRLRARVLEADRLTGKAMVTAGTLTEKSRSGARDINKFYGPGGPNYLKAAPVNPDELACQALLNCLIREVAAPEDQAWEDGGHLVIQLPRSGVTLRARLRRPSAGIGPRTAREVQVRQEGTWRDIGWQRLADLIAAELTMATGTVNAEFVSQVRDGHAAFAAILAARAERLGRTDHQVLNGSVLGGVAWAGVAGTGAAGAGGGDRIEAYLASEQALVAGHRFHPSPKTRQGAPQDWLRYAPEAGARFPLRFLAVREETLAEEGDGSALDRLGGPVPPPGTRLLPVHPWQFRLMTPQPWLRRAMDRGLLTDLGEGSREVVPTASVRTVYDPVADVFCKFSLNVRITNCLRKLAWYELPGAVVLTRRLAPVFAELGRKFPGTIMLGEPGYRTAALACRDAYEGLAVIVREGVRARIAPDVTPLLAASLTEPAGGLFDGRDGDWLLGWWQAYVRIVAPPVLDAFFGHGVVLEPHLQNVLVGVDGDGRPVQAVFRDLEGTKLVSSRHGALLAGLPPGVARGLAYDARRGWDRVAYCLLVNHLAEVAAAIADRCAPAAECERELWRQARQVLTEAAAEHGWPPELRAVLAGVPLPGKANLRLRWYRDADRKAEYIPVPNPLRHLEPERGRLVPGQLNPGLPQLEHA